MNIQLKYIALLVVLSLTGVFCYQGYWLIKMYNTTKLQSENTIVSNIRNADHIEIFMRADSINEKEEKERKMKSKATSNGQVSYSASFEKSDTPSTGSTTITKKITQDSIYTESEETVNFKAGDLKIGEEYNSLEMMARQLQQGLHSILDSEIAGINLAKFDSILSSNLARSQLNIKHYTLVVKLTNDSILSSSLPASVDTTALKRYEYIYDIHNEYAYRIYAEHTDGIILMQMSGILFTSFVILIILGLSFWFLIRTIMRQKTLDEMKSDFTNNITHELKTPIAVAYAANDALLNFNRADDKMYRDKYLNIAQNQLLKLSGLVEQILSMSMEHRKTFRLNMEEVHIDALIHSLVEQHKLKAEKPMRFIIEMEQEGMSVTTDRVHFSNIISNLIDNAIKYSPDEASVTIRCRMKNGKPEIAVSDEGIGIPAEKQSLIFDKFYRVPTGNQHNVKGYGLGLFYVKTMAEKLGGSISVRSESGKGSTFTLSL